MAGDEADNLPCQSTSPIIKTTVNPDIATRRSKREMPPFDALGFLLFFLLLFFEAVVEMVMV